MVSSGQVATCPYGTIVTINVGAYRSKLYKSSFYEKDLSLWVERLVDFRCRRHFEVREKEMYTARCPKTGPPGREGTKAELKR
ncbi:hypothetical protein [Pontibacter populi]|uniref:Uncharacterized protein n=1 Tax=Pontibacter populi TaxID=890055 RepID=A0ABV1RV07_9BACT